MVPGNKREMVWRDSYSPAVRKRIFYACNESLPFGVLNIL